MFKVQSLIYMTWAVFKLSLQAGKYSFVIDKTKYLGSLSL